MALTPAAMNRPLRRGHRRAVQPRAAGLRAQRADGDGGGPARPRALHADAGRAGGLQERRAQGPAPAGLPQRGQLLRRGWRFGEGESIDL